MTSGKRQLLDTTASINTVFRAGELYNQPPRPAKNGKPGRPATRGKFKCGKSHFYKIIEPRLEKVNLGPKVVAYTERSVEKVLQEGIEAAAVKRAAPLPRPGRSELTNTP